MSSILAHRTFGLDALTEGIHRLTAQAAQPGCTIEQVRHVLQHFGYQSHSRSETLLCLYWQLAEGHLNDKE